MTKYGSLLHSGFGNTLIIIIIIKGHSLRNACLWPNTLISTLHVNGGHGGEVADQVWGGGREVADRVWGGGG